MKSQQAKKGKAKPAGSTAAKTSKTTAPLVQATSKSTAMTSKETEKENEILPGVKCSLRDMDKVLLKDENNDIKESGRWPLLIDPNGQAATFLRYRDTNCLCTANSNEMTEDRVRKALIGAIRFGKPMVVDMLDTDMYDILAKVFDGIQPNLLNDVINKTILKDERYMKLVRPEDGEQYDEIHFEHHRVTEFMFILVSTKESPPENLLKIMFPVRVE